MEIKLNELSKDADDIEITLWHVNEKEHVVKGQDLLEVVTDKATFDVQSPCDGIIEKIFRYPGDKVDPDDIIAEIKENI